MSERLVVVGAGSAGAVIAARVSEDSDHEVLLLEAGPDYPAEALPDDLRDGRRNSTERHDWGYTFLPNESHDGSPFPRGRVTGGSSAVNTCIALRGQPYDFDEWAQIAGPQWSWSACLPAFKRLERDLDVDNEWHGQSGPIPVRRHRADELVPFQAAFLAACERAGHPACPDHNDPTTTGHGPHVMNKVDGLRISTASGYLSAEVRARPNLTIEADTQVVRVRLRRRRVVGLDVLAAREPRFIACSRVVLSAGAVATPGILARSGIGPKARLEAMGVAPMIDLPVGERLLDHPGTAMVFVPRPGVADGSHPLIQCTMRFGLPDGPPNEMQLQPVSFINLPGVPLLLAMTLVVGKPAGHGELWFPSADPLARPRILSRLGEHEADRVKLRESMKMAMAVARAPEVSDLAQLVWPHEAQLERRDTSWLLAGIGSGYHPCGTAPMGAVVDGHGRVHGAEGLFIADASIMPTIPTSNLNLATIMIGERFGEWLRDGPLR